MGILRVMTFNVRGATEPREGANTWSRRAALNVATIARAAPDVIGFQEVEQGNLDTYRDRLVGYRHVRGNRYGAPPWDGWTSIFWRAARFALVEAGEFWLSRTPDTPSRDWDCPEPLGATWVRLRCLASGGQVVHLNTHLDDQSERSRVEGSKLIAARLARLQGGRLPAIVTGDFNCNPGSPADGIFAEHGFVDTYLGAGETDGPASFTLHDFAGEGFPTSPTAARYGAATFWRIDRILTRDGADRLRARSCAILRDAEPPTYPSDHYPVVADLLCP